MCLFDRINGGSAIYEFEQIITKIRSKKANIKWNQRKKFDKLMNEW